jgi:hypothetical protein
MARLLRSQGVRRLAMCPGYLADQIEVEFGDGPAGDAAIDCSEESGQLIHARSRDRADLAMRGHLMIAARSHNCPQIFQVDNCDRLLGGGIVVVIAGHVLSLNPVFALSPTTPRSGLPPHTLGCPGSPSQEMEN